MSSILSTLGSVPNTITLPRLARESGGGYPSSLSGSTASALDAAEAALDRAIASEKDDEDKAELRKLVAQIGKIKADRAKERDDAMGLGAQHKFIRRSKQGA